MVELRTETTFARYSRGKYRYSETELFQEPGEAAVQLVAISSAAAVDYFAVERFRVQNYGLAEVYVEILERHGEHVSIVQTAENVNGWTADSSEADTIQIMFDFRFVSRGCPYRNSTISKPRIPLGLITPEGFASFEN